MHKKEFWILTNKCGNKLKHETEAEGSFHVHRIFFQQPGRKSLFGEIQRRLETRSLVVVYCSLMSRRVKKNTVQPECSKLKWQDKNKYFAY